MTNPNWKGALTRHLNERNDENSFILLVISIWSKLQALYILQFVLQLFYIFNMTSQNEMLQDAFESKINKTPPVAVSHIEQVSSLKLLGVILSMKKQVIGICSLKI